MTRDQELDRIIKLNKRGIELIRKEVVVTQDSIERCREQIRMARREKWNN